MKYPNVKPTCIDGIIDFTVTPDGTTGPAWIERLEKKGFYLDRYAKSVLTSPAFKLSNSETTEIRILKGICFADSERTTDGIRSMSDPQKVVTPHTDVACLIREKFTDEEIEAMGLQWIIIMHEPLEESHDGPYLLSVGRDRRGRSLCAARHYPSLMWPRKFGFGFAVPRVSLQNSVPLNVAL